MSYLSASSMQIFRTMEDAISPISMESRSTDAPPTRIHRLEMPLMLALSAQAIGHPHTSIPIFHGDGVISVASRKLGGSNFSMSRTNPWRSIRGLQPPQYLIPIVPFLRFVVLLVMVKTYLLILFLYKIKKFSGMKLVIVIAFSLRV